MSKSAKGKGKGEREKETIQPIRKNTSGLQEKLVKLNSAHKLDN